MSLGVLNNLSAMSAAHNLSNTQSSLSKTLEQLSSGSKINSGADDAAGLSLVNGLQANATALSQSQTNATEGVGLLTVADGALSQVTNLLNRAVTLATEVSNGTLNGSQNTAANQEYQSILSEINNIGATTTYNQKQVFGSQTGIYTGDSSTQGASINQLNIRSLSSDNVGDSNGVMAYSNGQSNVFVDLSKGGTNAAVTDTLTGGATGTTTLSVGYMTKGSGGSAVQATANITVGQGTNYSNTVNGLLSAINNSGLGITATFGTAANGGTGAVNSAVAAAGAAANKTSGLDTGIILSGAGIAANVNGANGVGEIGTLTISNATASANADTSVLSGVLSIADTNGVAHAVTLGTANSTDTLTNLATYVNQQGWGVTATYNAQVAGSGQGAKEGDIVFTSTSGKAGITQTSANLTASTTTGANTPFLTGQPTAAGTNSTTTLAEIAFGTTATGSDNITVNGTNLAMSAGETLGALKTQINNANLGVSASLDSSGNLFLTTSNSAAKVDLSTDAALTAGVPATFTQSTSSAFYSTGISGTITDTVTNGGTGTVGISNDSNGSSGVATISYSDSAGQSLSATDLANSTDAQSALTALNSAIAAVAAQDGYIGAQINTLNAVSSVMSTQQQNVVAAQNAVQATDYATAASNMSKYQILSQTGISALAQANSAQQAVLKLLQ